MMEGSYFTRVALTLTIYQLLNLDPGYGDNLIVSKLSRDWE